MTILPIILALFAALAITFMIDRDGFWQRLAGNPKLDQANFQTLEPALKPNEALACPGKNLIDFCPLRAPDIETGAYAVGVGDLSIQIRNILAELPLIERLDDGSDPLKFHFVRRTPILRFPDVFTIELIKLGIVKSTLAIHGRALVGQSDMGNNLKLTKQILRALAKFEIKP